MINRRSVLKSLLALPLIPLCSSSAAGKVVRVTYKGKAILGGPLKDCKHVGEFVRYYENGATLATEYEGDWEKLYRAFRDYCKQPRFRNFTTGVVCDDVRRWFEVDMEAIAR